MKFQFNTYQYIKNIIPHFLQFAGDVSYWANNGGLFWMAANGSFWGAGSDNRHLDWLRCLIAPLMQSYEEFRLYTDQILYRMNHNGQVIYLEHFLNDLFDLTERRIFIKDGTLDFPLYLFKKEENEAPLYIYNKEENEAPFYLYNRDDYGGNYEFIVCVPSQIILTESLTNQIKAAVNRYKIAGARYTIESF